MARNLERAADTIGMLSFQKLRVYQRSIEFLAHDGARGSGMEGAAALDKMRIMKLVTDTPYARGMDLVEAIVAMLTKMI